MKQTHLLFILFARAGVLSWSKMDSTQDQGSLRIVNGVDAQSGRYPYMVSLQNSYKHECGGSLIAPDIVLTAAHCADNDVLEAQIGQYDLASSEYEELSVAAHIIHPSYSVLYNTYDVALFVLFGNSSKRTVRLNSNGSLPTDNMTLTVIGWGDTGDGYYPDILQEVEVKYIPNEICKESNESGYSYETWIFPDMLCALDVGKDACAGDSGGPLFIRDDDGGDDIQVGIVSWGEGCASSPGVYARVSYVFDWIASSVCEISNEPPAYFGCQEPSKSPTPAPSSVVIETPTIIPTILESSQPPSRVLPSGITISPSLNVTASPAFLLGADNFTSYLTPTLSPIQSSVKGGGSSGPSSGTLRTLSVNQVMAVGVGVLYCMLQTTF